MGTKCRATLGPVTDSQFDEQLRAELLRLQRRTELILTSAGEGLYGLDAKGRATFVNPAAARMLGWEPEELVGHCMHANHHHHRADGSEYAVETCPIYAAFHDGKVHTVTDEVFWRRDGTSFPVEYTSTPILEDGELAGAVVVFRDITVRLRAEQDLRAALAEVESLRDRLSAENEYLRAELASDRQFGEILGESPATRALRESIETVAPSDASVLVTGETGTGKELVARAIHSLGPRHEGPLIRVNCASIPRELFESEFFGHVKGAFTGAIQDRDGRFQLAHRGTLFLDEVGEIPLAMQSKLLRVLQEGEFERVGEEKTRRVDVRVIAATNRDLRAESQRGRFRQDLYYRLNVFPIEVAPLRHRLEDVEPIARHFLQEAARRQKIRVPALTRADVQRLQRYSWVGNVRELQNVVERAVITARGGPLRFDLPVDDGDDVVSTYTPGPEEFVTEREMQAREKANLLAALRRAGGRVYGAQGAAALLGIKPTTLASRLRKLGIEPSRAR